MAVRHNRRREKLGFFLAILLKDLLGRKISAKELEFSDDTVDLLWLDNTNSEDAFTFIESYWDNKNSPYTIVDRAATDLVTVTGNLYCLSQNEANTIERILNGGDDSDIDIEEEESSDPDNDNGHPERVKVQGQGVLLVYTLHFLWHWF